MSGRDASSTVATPQQLADQFRRSGAFDLLRKGLIDDFLKSPDKAMLDARLDEIIPAALSRPSHKAPGSKKERHQSVVADIEGRHTVLHRVVVEVERSLRAKEREKESKGQLGQLSSELDRQLRRSRGERIDEPPNARASTSATLNAAAPSNGNGTSAHLPTPPHPDHLAPPPLLQPGASSSPSHASSSGDLSPLPPPTALPPLPTPERSPMPPVPPADDPMDGSSERVEELVMVKEEDGVAAPVAATVKAEAEDVEMPPAP
ncbi:hypothetical protein RQP46_006894 [Phenoliferia psychrophenolica]